METRNITKEEFDSLYPLKKGISHTDGEYVYKKTYFSKRNLEYLEIFLEVVNCNFKNLVLPMYRLECDDKDFGYMTQYYKNYKDMDTLVRRQKLFFKDKKILIEEFIKIIKEMHSIGLVHGDLHSKNILLTKEDIKIIDFDSMIIKDFCSDNWYKAKLKKDMKYITIFIMNLLCEKQFASSDAMSIPFIELLDISDEFKKYLTDCINEKDSIINIYPDNYLKEINGKVEIKAKTLLKGLK